MTKVCHNLAVVVCLMMSMLICGTYANAEKNASDSASNAVYHIGRYRSGTAVCAIDEDHWGIISQDGTWIIEPVYSYIQDAPDWEEITDDLAPIFDRLYYGGFEKGFYLISEDDNDRTRFGFYCIETATLCEPYWEELYLNNPVPKLILVCDPETEKWGYVNWYGEIAIPANLMKHIALKMAWLERGRMRMDAFI